MNSVISLLLCLVVGQAAAAQVLFGTASVAEGPHAVSEALSHAAQKVERSCGSPVIPVAYEVGSKVMGSGQTSFLQVEAAFECAGQEDPRGFSQAHCGPDCAPDGSCPKGMRCRYTWNCFGTCR